jgi:putative endonuclease
VASVYVLFSKKKNKFYIGSCKELNERIAQHKNKTFLNSYTSYVDDWELFFSINELHFSQARDIEKHIKKMKSKRYINNLKIYPEIVVKLRARFK